ncbi:sigma factor [Cohnella thermotolerans]|uniref:sigma factor n=1 Tax=Cohnella thermotolerans TaxID=329858 RepID=UPI0004202E2C|nr:sigma factor [Cohnella thermotolerans]
MTTEELVAAVSNGDDEAFCALVRSGKQRLYRIAYAYLKNETDALEAVQEATCRA